MGRWSGSFSRALGRTEAVQLILREHFSVDGTLPEAWTRQKSVRPLGDDDHDRSVNPKNNGVSLHVERRTNATHLSVTTLDA